MKVTAPILVEPPLEERAVARRQSSVAVGEKSLFAVFCDLVKARLTSLVLITTLVGFYAGSASPLDYWTMIHAMLGTALVACGAAALNQWLEREPDARMQRTKERPIPSGRLSPDTVLVLGAFLAVAGLLDLLFAVNQLTAFLGAITFVSYVFIYTPLKRVTTLNTFIGAIPGAIPPLMGWTAARGEVSAAGWSLFAILFVWQLPHFMAIAWLYREDYARGGFKMLPIVDPDGSKTAAQAVCHALGLIPVSLFPALLGVAGVVYFAGALVLGVMFLIFAIQFSRALTPERARRLFIASIVYLPVLLGLLVIDKVK